MYSWKENLIKYLDDGTWACEDMMKIINDNKPKSLFKYKSVNKKNISYIVKMIEENELWVSNPREFNDPYDCYLEFDYEKVLLAKSLEMFGDKINLQDKSKIDELVDKVRNAYEKTFEDEVNKTALACLCEENNNVLMWSHYADNHKGICIEYEFDEIDKLGEVYPVIYTENISDLTKDMINSNPYGILKRFMTKYKAWEYEKEWRIIYKNNDPSTIGGNSEFAKIKSIYLGCKIEDENKKAIIRLAKSKGVKIYQCSMRSDKYELNSNLLD
ncbi:MAG: DUF2971 domain-containing protein [Clostridium sp.]|uniref:DUF2971 domain-containing protein n=1 Tax=Clostridium sp. TaxID=1506 RepID=UPI003F31468B